MVRKLLLLSFLSIILSLAMTSAAIYEGNLFNGDNFTVGNDSYKITAYGENEYWMNYSTVVFRKNSTDVELFTAKYGSCAYTEFYDYCYDYTYYDFDKKKTYESNRIEPLIHIRIEYLTPVVEVSRPTATVLDYGKKFEIVTTIKNTGSNDALVDYVEEIPEGLVASECTGCTLINNVIKKKISLRSDAETTFRYYIIAYDYDTKNWKGTYNYTIENELKHGSIDYSATVNTPFKFSESISKTTTNNLDDYAIYTAIITNLDNYNSMNANIVIDVGDAIITESTGLKNSSHKYYYDGAISPASSESFTIKISSKMIGTYPLITNVTLSMNNEKYYSNTQNTFIVDTIGMVPSIDINRVKLVPGDNISLIFKLKNDATDMYYNVYGWITGLSDEYIHYVAFPANYEMVVYNTTYIVPELPNETVVTFIFNGGYSTEGGQELKFYAEKKLTVESIIPPIIINETITTINNTPNNTATGTPDTTITTPTDTTTPDTTTTSSDSDSIFTESEEENKDLLTRFFDSINKFFTNLFGKKE